RRRLPRLFSFLVTSTTDFYTLSLHDALPISWSSIYELSEKDYLGNVSSSSENVIAYDSSNCMIHVPNDKLVILKGLHNFIVVQADDTLMICPKDEEQGVKEIVADVKGKFGNKYS